MICNASIAPSGFMTSTLQDLATDIPYSHKLLISRVKMNIFAQGKCMLISRAIRHELNEVCEFYNMLPENGNFGSHLQYHK